MKSIPDQHWFFTNTLCLLLGVLVDSSSPSSVSSTVGNQVVLPCRWKPRLGEENRPLCHIQWAHLTDTVFEQQGDRTWQADEFKDRVEVQGEKLRSGDCSLIIKDVQFGDRGQYESFVLVDGERSQKTRVFIESVKLSVFDHKSQQTRQAGDDLVLELHTRHSFRVIFQGRNSSEWSDLWMRGDEDSERVEKHLKRQQLKIKKVTRSDEGTYKVLDEHGLAVSTVQLSVEETSPGLTSQQKMEPVPTDVSSRSCSSALLIFFALVLSSHLL
ncbi:galectin 17 [Mugil cephalus]|uniref:galectin 17 n=1 Tax=Mugil cephalus TaxID=48193 RepID=UPI001FB815DD|nr:galectin 17 [Mugil cephalus]